MTSVVHECLRLGRVVDCAGSCRAHCLANLPRISCSHPIVVCWLHSSASSGTSGTRSGFSPSRTARSLDISNSRTLVPVPSSISFLFKPDRNVRRHCSLEAALHFQKCLLSSTLQGQEGQLGGYLGSYRCNCSPMGRMSCMYLTKVV